MPKSFAEGMLLVSSIQSTHSIFVRRLCADSMARLSTHPCPLLSANGDVVATGAIQTGSCSGKVYNTPEINFMVARMTLLERAGMVGNIGSIIASLYWTIVDRLTNSGLRFPVVCCLCNLSRTHVHSTNDPTGTNVRWRTGERRNTSRYRTPADRSAGIRGAGQRSTGDSTEIVEPPTIAN